MQQKQPYIKMSRLCIWASGRWRVYRARRDAAGGRFFKCFTVEFCRGLPIIRMPSGASYVALATLAPVLVWTGDSYKLGRLNHGLLEKRAYPYA